MKRFTLQIKGTVQNSVYCKLVMTVKLVDTDKVTCKVNRRYHFTRGIQLRLVKLFRTEAMCPLKQLHQYYKADNMITKTANTMTSKYCF